jgi:hypothetical protein
LSSIRPPAASRVASSPGGPLFSLAVADLSSGNASSSGGAGRTPSFKQLTQQNLQEAAAAASAAQHNTSTPCRQDSQDCVLPDLQQSAQPQVRPVTTKMPSLRLQLSADEHITVSNSSDGVSLGHAAVANSDAATIAAAIATAGLKPPSLPSLACHSSGCSTFNGAQQLISSRRPGVRRTSPSSHHAHRQGLGGAAQQAAGARSNKPPPLSLFSSSTSSPGGSPHAFAHTCKWFALSLAFGVVSDGAQQKGLCCGERGVRGSSVEGHDADSRLKASLEGPRVGKQGT